LWQALGSGAVGKRSAEIRNCSVEISEFSGTPIAYLTI